MGRLQNPGFMRRSVWDPFQESMRMAIPLILQKNRLAQRKAEVDQRFELEGQEIVQKAEEAKLDAASKVMTDKLKLQGDMFEAEMEDKLEREKFDFQKKKHGDTLAHDKAKLESKNIIDLEKLVGSKDEKLRLHKEKQDYTQKLKKQMVDYKKKHGNTAPGAMSPNQIRLQEKDLATMAITIESDKGNPAVKQATEFFNKFASGNTVYLWKTTDRPFLGDKQEAVRVELPIYNGEQVTAIDIRETLKINKGKTLEDVLRSIGAIE